VKYIKVIEEESHSINHESSEPYFQGLSELRVICAIAQELGKLTASLVVLPVL